MHRKDAGMAAEASACRFLEKQGLKLLERNFRCRNGANFEVFEYDAAAQRTEPPRNSDVGGHHVALYVDDLDAAIAHLRSHGVRLLGEPVHRLEGPNGGRSWIYFLAPWGMQFELVSYPRGMGYERTTTARMWDPRHPP